MCVSGHFWQSKDANSDGQAAISLSSHTQVSHSDTHTHTHSLIKLSQAEIRTITDDHISVWHGSLTSAGGETNIIRGKVIKKSEERRRSGGEERLSSAPFGAKPHHPFIFYSTFDLVVALMLYEAVNSRSDHLSQISQTGKSQTQNFASNLRQGSLKPASCQGQRQMVT